MTEPALPADAVAAIDAALARIIPSDDGPGAREAGTIGYVLARSAAVPAIRRDLAELAGRLDELARTPGVTSAAGAAQDAAFATLEPASADAILARLDAVGDPGFGRLVTLAMEGFYGDPRHGGNRDGLSWAMLGFPGPTGGRGYEPPLGWYDAHVPRDPADEPA